MTYRNSEQKKSLTFVNVTELWPTFVKFVLSSKPTIAFPLNRSRVQYAVVCFKRKCCPWLREGAITISPLRKLTADGGFSKFTQGPFDFRRWNVLDRFHNALYYNTVLLKDITIILKMVLRFIRFNFISNYEKKL